VEFGQRDRVAHRRAAPTHATPTHAAPTHAAPAHAAPIHAAPIHAAPTHAGRGRGAPALAHAVGLDGVRALAVVAVLAYHSTDGLLHGGFLGVDVFFVLSGYLITSLLMVEGRQTGTIKLSRFYLRRARRLLPALYTLLLVVGGVVVVFFAQYAARVRGDLLAALGYVTNWWLIAQNSSYFGSGSGPGVLNHLWSLAVEEQFYLIWPVLLLLLGRGRASRRLTATFLVLAIAASGLAMALLYNPWGDPSRVYFGTDTRGATPLIGALLAILVRPWRQRRDIRAATKIGIDVLGLLALGALGLAVTVAGDRDDWLYRGGFLAVAGVAGILVVAAAHPASRLGRLLGIAPLRWLGDRSYAIYLWHWPICVFTAGLLTSGTSLFLVVALRVALTLLVADLSFRLVEHPIRTGSLGRAWARLRAERGLRRTWLALRATGISMVALLAVTGLSYRLAGAPAPANGGVPVDPGPAVTLGPVLEPTPSPSPGPVTPSATPSHTPPKLPINVAVFGDSQGMTLIINKPADTGKYLRLTDATVEGCGVLLGRVVSRSGERRDLTASCSGWADAWRADANRVHPQIALVMLGAWDVFDLHLGDQVHQFGSPEWDQDYLTALGKGIDLLRASKAQVALALLPCYRPVRASAGYWPERGDDARTRHVNYLLRTAASADPAHVFTVEPPAAFCTDPKISKNLAYRWDGVHYYKPGAALYLKTVIPQLLALPLN
jgi:peptidoglycan/LPS O-acetylase OafA/YrhL